MYIFFIIFKIFFFSIYYILNAFIFNNFIFFYNLFSFLNFSNLHKSFLLSSIFLSLSFLFSNLFFHKASFFYCYFFNQFSKNIFYNSLFFTHFASFTLSRRQSRSFLFIDSNIIFFLLPSFPISFAFFLMSKTILFFFQFWFLIIFLLHTYFPAPKAKQVYIYQFSPYDSFFFFENPESCHLFLPVLL